MTDRKAELIALGNAYFAEHGRIPRSKGCGIPEATVRQHFGSWLKYLTHLGPQPETKATMTLGPKGLSIEFPEPKPEAPRATGTNPKLVAILPDIHFPYEDKQALEAATRVVEALKPSRVILLGDVLDCSQFSRHSRRSPGEGAADDYLQCEVAPANSLIDRLLGSCDKVTMLAGNHEARIARWCAESGLGGSAALGTLDPKRLLSEGRGREFEYIEYLAAPGITNYTKVTASGSLIACHGWSFAENVAAVHLRKAKTASVVFGHAHRQQLVSERDPFSGRILKAWCPGTLSELSPLYAVGGAPTTWTHGMSLVYCGSSGESFTEYLLTIDRGRSILPDGTEVTA